MGFIYIFGALLQIHALALSICRANPVDCLAVLVSIKVGV